MSERERPHITETGQCRSCSAAVVNGVFCHEHGCPDAWRDKQMPCVECGIPFYQNEPGQYLCSEECTRSYYGDA